MKNKEWLPILEARNLLVEKHLHRFSNSYLLVHRFAWDLICNDLTSHLLPSRPASAETFYMHFKSEIEEQSIPLDHDGLIPWSFWLHYQAADEEANSGLALKLPTLDQGTYARLESDVDYRLSYGLRDNGVIEANAANVLVKISRLPGSRPRGRPLGSRIDDTAIVAMAVEAIESGATIKAAIDRYARHMPNNSELSSRQKRLRSRLRELGAGE